MSKALVSLWEATAAPSPHTAAFEGTSDVDVAIVGGGYTGLSAALHLAEQGASVVVLEQHAIGYGASGRNGGQVNPGIKLDPPAIRSGYDGPMADRIIQQTGGAPDALFDIVSRHNIDCSPVQNGWVLPAHNETALKKLQKKADSWRELGVAMRMLDRSETADLIGTDRYIGSLLDPRGGAVQPLSLARGLAKAALEAGAKIYTQSPVDRISRNGDGWTVTTARGTVRARKILIATNGYTGPLWPKLARSVVAANSFQIATDDLPEELAKTIVPHGQTVSDSRRIVIYFRRHGNRFVIGGRGRFGGPRSSADFKHLYDTARQLYPALSGIPFNFHWAGRVAMTMDGLPHIHEPEPGLLIALGYNGRGVALATALGPVLAGHLLGKADNLPFGSTPITPIPMHGLQRLYVTAALIGFRILDSF
jgi:glycine/D-amino acid oxidase-like deaminating enzyme